MRAPNTSFASSLTIPFDLIQCRLMPVKNSYELIRQKLENGRPILLDGAVGTEVVRRGVRWRQHGLRTDAATVQAIHEDYVAAGADVITTNTFQLTRRLFLNLFRDLDHMRRIGREGLEHQADELTRKAVNLAQKARDKNGKAANVAIAGSIAPLEHCFRPDLSPPYDEVRTEKSRLARLLAESGVDLILVETMNTIQEACASVEAARATGLPVWVSFVLGPRGDILSGESLSDAVKSVEPLGPDVILLNCAPPDDITRGLETLAKTCRVPFGAYAHIGRYDPPSWKFEFHPQFCETEQWPPARYAEYARKWRRLGAAVIGGCCGTTPAHIEALKKDISEGRS